MLKCIDLGLVWLTWVQCWSVKSNIPTIFSQTNWLQIWNWNSHLWIRRMICTPCGSTAGFLIFLSHISNEHKDHLKPPNYWRMKPQIIKIQNHAVDFYLFSWWWNKKTSNLWIPKSPHPNHPKSMQGRHIIIQQSCNFLPCQVELSNRGLKNGDPFFFQPKKHRRRILGCAFLESPNQWKSEKRKTLAPLKPPKKTRSLDIWVCLKMRLPGREVCLRGLFRGSVSHRSSTSHI